MAKYGGFVNPHLVVDGEWLSQHLNDPDLRIVDVRPIRRHLSAHIPNSVNFPPTLLDDPESPIRDLPTKSKFEAIMSELGVGNDNLVVAVDEDSGPYAGRLFWMLEYYGHDKVCVLDGGFLWWSKVEGREVTDKVPRFPKTKFVARPRPELLATKAEILEKIGKSGVMLIDARLREEYVGEVILVNRGGHMPGAINIDSEENCTEEEVRRLKPAEDLKALYDRAKVTKDKEIILYCEGGERSCFVYFVLRLLGYSNMKVYYGSWREWDSDLSTPIETT